MNLRTLAVWGFDSVAMIVGFELVEGRYLNAAIERLLATPQVAYLHIYVGQPTRYAARVERN